MNVLSLFDGIACGKVALDRAGISVDNYFSSEIDKYAIAVAKYNHRDIIHLGDIRNWKEWNLPKIDMIIGGSPCQGFSSAGKGLNFEDDRSKLFFTFVEILQHYIPQYFLLENVKMKQEWQDIISKCMQVKPILIDSALLSAQSRKRLYWTNIPSVVQPIDKGILLQDIIEDGFTETNKSYCIDSNYYKGSNYKNYFENKRRQIIFGCAHRIRYDKNGITYRKLEIREDYKSNAIMATFLNKQYACNCYSDKVVWRKLTPIECERLQTLPDNYTQYGLFVDTVKPISNTQRYKMLGNGWTVDVISHIFSFINKGG